MQGDTNSILLYEGKAKKVFSHDDIDKVIIDKESGSGVVPYLPLPELKKGSNN